MASALYDITAEQGSTYGQVMTCRDAAGTLIDLSGFTARMQVRDGYAGEAAILDLTTENGGIALGGVLGTITLAISASDLAAISLPPAIAQTGRPSKPFVYDLEIVSGAVVTKLLYGTFTITGEVTR